MPNISLAERILSLAMPTERAHSTVGDLAEEAESRGSAWFWSNVVRTTGSQLWREIAASPFGMLRLAAWEWLAESLLVILLLIAVNVMIDLIYGSSSPLAFALNDAVIRRWSSAPVLVFSTRFWASKMMADRSKGREFSAAIALNLVAAILHVFALYQAARQARGIGQPWLHVEPYFPQAVWNLLLSVSAALWVRHRRQLTRPFERLL